MTAHLVCVANFLNLSVKNKQTNKQKTTTTTKTKQKKQAKKLPKNQESF